MVNIINYCLMRAWVQYLTKKGKKIKKNAQMLTNKAQNWRFVSRF